MEEEPRAEEEGPATISDTLKIHSQSPTKRYSEILRDFDNLDLSLVYCPEELDPEPQPGPGPVSAERSESEEQDSVSQGDDTFPAQICSDPTEMDTPSAQDADQALCRCEGGVEMALQYSKMWCRYCKDLLTWMEKRIALEQEFAKNVIKTAEGARACVTQQEMMPMQYIYTMALEQDIKNSQSSRQTSELILQRCYQALVAKKNEIDKWRREFKEQWAKEQKKMHDVVAAWKKARQQYQQRCEELEKAKAGSARASDDMSGTKTLDKRRKSRDEAKTKVTEAEAHYRQCVSDARVQQDELAKVKERIITHVRKLVCQGDTVLKEATVNMFYYQRQQTEPVPLGYHNLELTCRHLEPGEPYLLYILSRRRREQPQQCFTFQEYISQGKGQEKTKRKTSNPLSTIQDLYSPPDDVPMRRHSDGRRIGLSDGESMEGSMESLSSPATHSGRLPKVSSSGAISSEDLDDRDPAGTIESDGLCSPSELQTKVRVRSRAALTHRLRKMKSKMVKCKQCDNYIMVNGVECEECGLALHRKCLEVYPLECERGKGVVFGVGLGPLCRDRPDGVPFVVRRCTAEIESHSLAVQGIYRVCGSKPRIQRLCQAFESQGQQVELSDFSPHDITSVLKHFFKELPEPLLTYDLYGDFINMGKAIQRAGCKDQQPTDATGAEDILSNLCALLRRLPPPCYSTLQHMMSHLHRVSTFEQNMMSAGNLGIVFGPTLLRPLVTFDMSMVALVESTYQALLVEVLILHYDCVFGPPPGPSTTRPAQPQPQPEPQPQPPPPPTTPLPETPPGPPCPLMDQETPSTVPEQAGSCRDRPQSLESRTIERESSEGYISDKSSSNEAVDRLSPEANEGAVVVVSGEPAGGPDRRAPGPADTQSHYTFTRQPVKYQRHSAPGARRSSPWTGLPRCIFPNDEAQSEEGVVGVVVVTEEEEVAGVEEVTEMEPVEYGGSTDSSPSSPSLDPWTKEEEGADARSLGVDCGQGAGQGAEPEGPGTVLEPTLALDPGWTATATATTTTTPHSTEDCRSGRGTTDPSTGEGSHGEEGAGCNVGRPALCPASRVVPGELPLSAPAHKVLSGLKLRRRHSGSDEQLFV